MTDPKQLPDDLDQLKETLSFQEVEENYTVKILREKLTAAHVDFYSSDDKPSLVWRWMDSQGMAFSDELAEDDAQKTTPKNESDVKDDTHEEVTANDVISNANDSNDTQADDKKQPDENQTSDDSTDVVPSESDGTNTAAESDDGANTADSDRSDIDDGVECVLVENKGAFGILEPATVTMMRAGEKTKIKVTHNVDRDAIIRNISQFNRTRGDILQILN